MSFLKNSRNYMLFMLTALCSQVFGHTYLSSVYLNNQLLNEGDCVRPHPSTAFDSPIPLVTSPDMTCGWLPSAARPANRKCPVSAGSTIGIQWHHNSNSASDDIIQATHKGPVMVYLAKSDSGAGNVWFKIYEDGYANGRWGVDRLLDAKGRVDVTIPADIAPGNYLLRGEVLALHSAYDINGVQPYVGCVELTVTGSGSATPSGVALPGYYKNTDPGMLINIYQTVTNYIIPGPAVYKSGSSSSSSGSSSSGSSGSTSAPTSRPPTASTTRPTDAPTTRPTDAPTTRPPTASTTRPTDAPNPTSGPSDGSSLKFQVNGESNIWWFAIATSGGNEDTVKVELKDSGSVPNYYILSSASYGWFFSQSIQLTLPISLRFTSASGKQIVLENCITSYTDTSLKDTQKYYGATSTTAPAQKPTGVTLKQHSASSAWWFAIEVNGVDSSTVSSIEIKDSDTVTNYAGLQSTDYGYYIFPTRGSALVAPISVRVTLTSGKQATATFNSFSGEAQISI